MKEINVDFIEKTEEGLVKKNFTTKMKLVEGLEDSLAGLKKKVNQIDVLEVSEYSSVATNKDEDVYTKVEWKDREGNLYATSTIIEDKLSVTYHKLNKKISWKLFFDEDGFIYKKELI